MPLISGKRFAAAAVAVLVGGLALVVDAKASATFDLVRVAGADRYATASAVAGNAFPSGGKNAVLARGDDFPDALAGAYLSMIVGGPVLLTDSATLSQATKDRLSAMGAETVYLLGGTAAISQAVADELAKTYTVNRVAGANRYDTGSKIAQTANPAGVGTRNGNKTAIVTTGENFPDALAAGSASFGGRFPIVLTRAGSLPDESKAALTALGIKHAIVVGGSAAVGGAVVNELTTMGVTSERVAGSTRYGTATALADFEIDNLTGWSNAHVDLTTGERFADALAGGPASGKSARPLLLTTAGELHPDTKAWLQLRAASLQSGRVFGGSAAVSDATVGAAEQAAGGGSQARTGQVVRVDAANHRYTFVPDDSSEPITVNYKEADSFAVDGSSAELDAFADALSAADKITHTGTSGSTPPSHVLAEVEPGSIDSGTVGDVNVGAHSFKFINPVTGDPLTDPIDYSDGSGWSIDGVSGKTAANVDADINEGDQVTINGTAFALTNKALTGIANTITRSSNPLSTSTTFKIDVFGDNPASGDTPPLITTNDSVFVASGASSTTDVYVGDADTWSEFNTQLSDGDEVTYSRASGAQRFSLVDSEPTTYAGQAAAPLTLNGDSAPGNDSADGGTFTMALPTKAYVLRYTTCASGCFFVNGTATNEAGFEAAYSAGDLVKLRAADTVTGVTQRVELVDQALSGRVDQLTINATGNPGANPSRSYKVLATNGFTVLATVTYATSEAAANVYFVDGAEANQATFEAALTQILDGEKAGFVTVEAANEVQTHRLSLSV